MLPAPVRGGIVVRVPPARCRGQRQAEGFEAADAGDRLMKLTKRAAAWSYGYVRRETQ